MLTERQLRRDEIEQVWTIDRSEVIEHIYYLEAGQLVRRPKHYDVRGWPPGEADVYTSSLLECFDRGGWFYGVFDESRLIAAAVLESRFIGRNHDTLQLKFLHVSRAYRRQRLGRRLFELAREVARARGARRMYVSATPSANTIDFYLRRGCVVAREPDPALLALEPEDIHLECDV